MLIDSDKKMSDDNKSDSDERMSDGNKSDSNKGLTDDNGTSGDNSDMLPEYSDNERSPSEQEESSEEEPEIPSTSRLSDKDKELAEERNRVDYDEKSILNHQLDKYEELEEVAKKADEGKPLTKEDKDK
jgi:hypothetical protein